MTLEELILEQVPTMPLEDLLALIHNLQRIYRDSKSLIPVMTSDKTNLSRFYYLAKKYRSGTISLEQEEELKILSKGPFKKSKLCLEFNF